jgi:hypothetical protein
MKFVITVLKLAALLHDIADSKFNNGDESIGLKLQNILESENVDQAIIDHVVKIIENIFPIKEVISKEFTNRIKYSSGCRSFRCFRAIELRERSPYADSRIERSMTPKLPQTRR